MSLTFIEFKKKFEYFANKYSIHFRDLNLYVIAFCHGSYSNEHDIQSNDRFALLGDTVFQHFFIKRMMKDKNITLTEITTKQAFAKSDDYMVKYAKSFGFDEMIFFGKGIDHTLNRVTKKAFSDLLPAFLGAMLIDLEDSYEFIESFLDKYVFSVHSYDKEIDYKTDLQILIQSEKYKHTYKNIEYRLHYSVGPSHESIHEVGLYFDGKLYMTATGRSRKNAEKEAARKVYNMIAQDF